MNKDHKHMINVMMQNMQETFTGQVPASLVLISKKHGVINTFFPYVETPEHKNEIALIGILLGALLADVELIGVITEAFSISVNPEDNPDIFKKCGDDPMAINAYLKELWPDFANCPYRKEVFVGNFCDGENNHSSQIEIEYDENKKRINKSFSENDFINAGKSDINFNVTFNSLLHKAHTLKPGIKDALNDGFDNKSIIKALAKSINFKVNVEKIHQVVNQILTESHSKGEKPQSGVTVH